LSSTVYKKALPANDLEKIFSTRGSIDAPIVIESEPPH